MPVIRAAYDACAGCNIIMGSRAALLFRTIEAPGTPWNRWATSLGVHVALVASIAAIPLGVNKTSVPPQADLRVQLIAPRPAVQPPPKRNFPRAPVHPLKIKREVTIKREDPVEVARLKPPSIRIAGIEP